MSSKNASGMTPLMLAGEQGSFGIMELLFDSEIKQDVKDEGGRTCLHVAAECGHKSCVAQCLVRGHDVNVRNKVGNTALHLASLRGHQEVVSCLLAERAVESIVNEAGYRPDQIAMDQDLRTEIQKGLMTAEGNRRTIAWV